MNNYPYPSKLLLFGEHIVLKGAKALAIPYPELSGRWQLQKEANQYSLAEFGDYLFRNFPDHFSISSFQEALADGLYFDSQIPTGYGLGSSGALVAATYDWYFKKEELSLLQLKKLLAQMENYFHSNSSGVDPLVCYLNEMLLIDPSTGIFPQQKTPNDDTQLWTFFLIDTQKSRKTGPLVNHFFDKYKNGNFAFKINNTAIPLNNRLIDTFLQNDYAQLAELWKSFSQFQLTYFNEFIDSPFYQYWESGLKRDLFYCKLCGAGGGGFILGLTKDFEATKEYLSGIEVIKCL